MMKRWSENDIPNQKGRVAIVTGANSGIGWETARALAQRGAIVILACRNMQKANSAADQVRQLNPAGKVAVMQLDLGDLNSVRTFADAFRAKNDRLNLLINNAGIMFTPYGKTVQGFEQQFGINHLGHFALTGLLLDLLNETPGARIVTVTSNTHRIGIIDFDNLNWEQDYDPQQAYGRSKLANLLFAYELQRRLTTAGKNTLSVAAHPGWTRTNLTRNSSSFMRLIDRIFGQRPNMGALPTLYAAISPDVRGGEYFGPDSMGGSRGYPQKAESNDRSHDEDVARQLWYVSEDLTQVKYHL
jgi:NAD(P)-dependent dehydrogenase (short-subunit alcohol dehydrogenase family)